MCAANKILKLNFFYFSNFPIKSNFILPRGANNLSNRKVVYNSAEKKICKNFFLLILFIKYLTLKSIQKNNFFVSYKFFIKPNQQNIFNYLRAPYKNKLARNQLYIPRYKFSLQITISTLTKIFFNSNTHYNIVLNFLKKYLIGVSSNIFYINKIKIQYKAFCRSI